MVKKGLDFTFYLAEIFDKILKWKSVSLGGRGNSRQILLKNTKGIC